LAAAPPHPGEAISVHYARDDGFTLVGDHPAKNMIAPIRAAVRYVYRMIHRLGNRVFINQFYCIEMLTAGQNTRAGEFKAISSCLSSGGWARL
jgi:hypothetical protein